MTNEELFGMAVHPAADVFPMLASDELAELAEDIKANGLIHPLIVKDGVLVDGRNRREACRLAGVVPTIKELNGSDPVAYILSSNINRRHMTKSQRAMAVAMIYPEPEKGGRGKNSSVAEEFGTGRISMARTVLKWAPELAGGVLSGLSLDEAYSEATTRKGRAETEQVRLGNLRTSAPDLADKVIEESLSLDDAEAAAKARKEKERVVRQGVYDGLRDFDRSMFLFRGEHLDYLAQVCCDHPDELSRDKVCESLDSWISTLKKAKAAL